ncbi:alpha/beta hydrolase family protein [Nocardioides sp. LML1-1-1.1]|uniref:alpha/beta hydrolase family protein n=1 Tax=Nocardioides sp. LML1-1-1.1 TaxID=3135248 RepID=UPI0034279722
MRRVVGAVLLALLLGACSATTPEADPPAPRPSATTSPATSASPSAAAPDPVSLAALAATTYDGARLRLGEEVLRGPRHREYRVTYRGGGLTLSGRIAVPDGKGPFPAVVLAHGYIDPAVYVNGQGMTRERAWFGEHGYVALHVDYRGHAESSPDRSGGLDMRMGYTEDVVNAVLALRAWDGPVDDERIALVGRSMGGGVVQNALTVQPGLVRAGVAFASVSSDAAENFEHFIRGDDGRGVATRAILRAHGEPADRPAFWAGISARSRFDDITEPVLLLHGTADDTCPIAWSRQTARLMRRAGVDVTLRTYAGEGHAFGPRFEAAMEETERFLRVNL